MAAEISARFEFGGVFGRELCSGGAVSQLRRNRHFGPVRREIVHPDELAAALVRTAFSTSVREAGDLLP